MVGEWPRGEEPPAKGELVLVKGKPLEVSGARSRAMVLRYVANVVVAITLDEREGAVEVGQLSGPIPNGPLVEEHLTAKKRDRQFILLQLAAVLGAPRSLSGT